MLGQDSVTVLVIMTLGVAIVIAQPFSTTTLKPSQGLGPDHCTKCGTETDDASKKLGIIGASISSCNLYNGISAQGINASLFECVCKSQFNGTYNGMKSDGIKCYDVDECTSNTDWCDNHAICTNTVGGFHCECDEGLLTDDDGKTCNDIRECATGHVCGYEGKYGDFGSCSEEFGSYSCDCKTGFLRVNQAENGKNETCEKPTHGDFGSCKEIFGSYYCKCRSGFLNVNQTARGDKGSCENINECNDANTCPGDHKLCRDTVGSYVCYCSDGYEYINSTCQNISECAVNGTNNCEDFAKCVDKDGSFECQCEGDGFRFVSNSNTVCEDYNECDEKNYTCQDPHKSQCYNLLGGYSCRCDPGYMENNMTGICEDIDECWTGAFSCPGDAGDGATRCRNLDGSYECICEDGYLGIKMSFNHTKDGQKTVTHYEYCADIDECVNGTHECGDNTVCTNIKGSYTCDCTASGYERVNSTTCQDINECVSTSHHICTDENKNLCINTDGAYECGCNGGFEPVNSTAILGNDIQICRDIDECYGSNNCSSDSTCANLPGTYSCKCNQGYEGDGTACNNIDECSLPIKDPIAHNCHQNAVCTDTKGGFYCTCRKGFTGDGTICTEDATCPPPLLTASAGENGFAVLPVSGLYGLKGADYNISFPPGEYPVTSVVSPRLSCKIILKVYTPNLRRRVEFEANYKVDCKMATNSLTLNLINTVAVQRYSVIEHICDGLCKRQSADIKPTISCNNTLLTVRWPTDLSLPADKTQASHQLTLKVAPKLLNKTPLLDLLIVTAKPPVVYPIRTSDGALASLRLTPYCLMGKYSYQQDDCVL